MKNLLRLLRLRDYPRNLLVFLPLFFSGDLLNIHQLWPTFVTFVGMLLLVQGAYIFNDWMDIDYDKRNPNRKPRPLATGSMLKPQAFILMMGLMLLGFYLGLLVNWNVLTVFVLYVLLMSVYSFKLKHIPIVDISIVAIGLVIRLLAGALAADTPLSPFMVMLGFVLGLFLVLGRRHDEYLYSVENGLPVRPALVGYSERLFDVSISVLITIMVVGYMLYTIVGHSLSQIIFPHLYLTTFFVMAGVMRYLRQVYANHAHFDPYSMLFKDKTLLLIFLLWLLSFILILYT